MTPGLPTAPLGPSGAHQDLPRPPRNPRSPGGLHEHVDEVGASRINADAPASALADSPRGQGRTPSADAQRGALRAAPKRA
eukprot:13773337-Alexandrium_andersonii.AAC.1